MVHVGLARLVAPVALLGEVLGHPVGPGWRLSRLAVLPHPRALAHAHKLPRLAGIWGGGQEHSGSTRTVQQNSAAVAVTGLISQFTQFSQFTQ